jgi:hypothetical protein
VEGGRVRKIKLTPTSKGLELAVKYHRRIDAKSRSEDMELDLGSMTAEERPATAGHPGANAAG